MSTRVVPEGGSVEESRWVTRRAQFLASQEIGYREAVAEAVAWSELGYSQSGIASRMDVSGSTAKKYVEQAGDRYPGICVRSYIDIGGDPEAGVGDINPGPPRQCPVCTKERLMSADHADDVTSTSDWGATAMLDNADLVCEWCHAARIDGRWERMQMIGDRAQELASGGGKKTRGDYREMLTAGIDPGKAGDGGGDPDRAADPDEVDVEGW